MELPAALWERVSFFLGKRVGKTRPTLTDLRRHVVPVTNDLDARLGQVFCCDTVCPVAEQVHGTTRDVKDPAHGARLVR